MAQLSGYCPETPREREVRELREEIYSKTPTRASETAKDNGKTDSKEKR